MKSLLALRIDENLFFALRNSPFSPLFLNSLDGGKTKFGIITCVATGQNMEFHLRYPHQYFV